jgi:hypothetical protein
MKFYKVAYRGKIVYLRKVKQIAKWTGIPYDTIMNWTTRGVKPKKYKIEIETIKTTIPNGTKDIND